MKFLNHRILTLGLVLSLALILVRCGEEGEATEREIESPESPVADEIPENMAVSTWDGHSLREDGDRQSKWLASVSFGEKMELLEEQMDDPNGK